MLTVLRSQQSALILISRALPIDRSRHPYPATGTPSRAPRSRVNAWSGKRADTARYVSACENCYYKNRHFLVAL